MAGELTLDEKLAMTERALKALRTQQFEGQLHALANVRQFRGNAVALNQHNEKMSALSEAITQLEIEHRDLTEEKTTVESSAPSSPSSPPGVLKRS